MLVVIQARSNSKRFKNKVMHLIYNKLIKKKRIYGLVHEGKWFHLGTFESLNEYKKMLK